MKNILFTLTGTFLIFAISANCFAQTNSQVVNSVNNNAGSLTDEELNNFDIDPAVACEEGALAEAEVYERMDPVEGVPADAEIVAYKPCKANLWLKVPLPDEAKTKDSAPFPGGDTKKKSAAIKKLLSDLNATSNLTGKARTNPCQECNECGSLTCSPIELTINSAGKPRGADLKVISAGPGTGKSKYRVKLPDKSKATSPYGTPSAGFTATCACL